MDNGVYIKYIIYHILIELIYTEHEFSLLYIWISIARSSHEIEILNNIIASTQKYPYRWTGHTLTGELISLSRLWLREREFNWTDGVHRKNDNECVHSRLWDNTATRFISKENIEIPE